MTSSRSPGNDDLTANLTANALAHRIAWGESPQALLADLVSAAQPHNFTPVLCSLRVLVANGARVATCEKGCAFETLIRNPMFMSGLLFSDVMSSLMLVPGEVPFHILARDRPGVLFSRLSLGASCDTLAGLHKRDASGRTPAHWLWAPDGESVQYANQACVVPDWYGSGEDARVILWMATLQAVWQTQALLQDLGIGMDTPDNDGITALDLCLERIAADDVVFLPGHAICDQVRARLVGRGLACDTPPADPKSAPAGLRF